MPEHDEGPSDGGRDWRTHVVVGLAVLALVHSLLVALWLAPAGPVRDVAGDGRLARYVDPYFRQSWDLLEPSSQRVDEALWVRARVRVGPEELTETPWLDVTKVELAASRSDVAPSRSLLAGRRLATNLNTVLFDLGEAGRDGVLESYVGTDEGQRRALLVEAGASVEEATAYLTVDEMTTRFASLYTQAYADQRVVQVQYRVGRRTVPPRADRDEQRVAAVPFAWFDAGWRTAVRGTASAQDAFDDLLEEHT